MPGARLVVCSTLAGSGVRLVYRRCSLITDYGLEV